MSEKKNPSYERYRRGMALQLAGVPAKDIALKLGLKDAQAWYTTRHYYSSKKLAERTAPTAPNDPEPAAILEGIDCQRDTPRDRGAMRNAECEMLNAKEAMKIGESIVAALQAGIRDAESKGPYEIAKMITQQSAEELHRLGYITPNQAKAALVSDGHMDAQRTPAPRRLAVTQLISAEGEKVRYRLHDGMVFINSKGQKKCALRLTVDEMKVMIAELGDFLMEAGV